MECNFIEQFISQKPAQDAVTVDRHAHTEGQNGVSSDFMDQVDVFSPELFLLRVRDLVPFHPSHPEGFH